MLLLLGVTNVVGAPVACHHWLHLQDMVSSTLSGSSWVHSLTLRSNCVLFAITANLTINFIHSGQTSIDIAPAFTVQGILVVCEFLCVAGIYLARAMNDFHHAGPEITLSSAKDNTSGRHGKGKSNSAVTSHKLKSLRSDTSGVRATVTHNPSSDADSDNSQRGIVKKVEYEVNSEDPHRNQQQRGQYRKAAGRSIQWDSIDIENR